MIYALHFIVICLEMISQVHNSTTILTKECIDSLRKGWEEYAWCRINKGIQLYLNVQLNFTEQLSNYAIMVSYKNDRQTRLHFNSFIRKEL